MAPPFSVKIDASSSRPDKQARKTLNLMRVCVAAEAVRFHSSAKQIEEAVKRKLHSVMFAEKVPDDGTVVRYSLRVLCYRAREELLATAATAVISEEAAAEIKDFQTKLESILFLKEPPSNEDAELQSAFDWACALANKELLAVGISPAFMAQVASMPHPPMPTAEDRLAQTRKVTLKAGTYYIGDPCYMFEDSNEWGEFCNAHFCPG